MVFNVVAMMKLLLMVGVNIEFFICTLVELGMELFIDGMSFMMRLIMVRFGVMTILKVEMCVMNLKVRVSVDVMMDIEVLSFDMMVRLMVCVVFLEMMTSMMDTLERVINWVMWRKHLMMMLSCCNFNRKSELMVMVHVMFLFWIIHTMIERQ